MCFGNSGSLYVVIIKTATSNCPVVICRTKYFTNTALRHTEQTDNAETVLSNGTVNRHILLCILWFDSTGVQTDKYIIEL